MQRADHQSVIGEGTHRNKKELKQSISFDDKGEVAQISSKLPSVSVLRVLHPQVKCSVKSMRISNCQGIWAVSERLAALCFLRAERKFSKLWS